jgi:hypothetical protein
LERDVSHVLVAVWSVVVGPSREEIAENLVSASTLRGPAVR